MSWALQIREKVKKRFQRLPDKYQRKIRETLFELEENPYSGDFVRFVRI